MGGDEWARARRGVPRGQKANLFAKPKDGRTAPVIADEAGMSAFKFRVILAQAEMRKAKH